MCARLKTTRVSEGVMRQMLITSPQGQIGTEDAIRNSMFLGGNSFVFIIAFIQAADPQPVRVYVYVWCWECCKTCILSLRDPRNLKNTQHTTFAKMGLSVRLPHVHCAKFCDYQRKKTLGASGKAPPHFCLCTKDLHYHFHFQKKNPLFGFKSCFSFNEQETVHWCLST